MAQYPNEFVPVLGPDGSEIFMPPEVAAGVPGYEQQNLVPGVPVPGTEAADMGVVPAMPEQPVEQVDPGPAPPWMNPQEPAPVAEPPPWLKSASVSGYRPETPVEAAQTQQRSRGIQGALNQRSANIQDIAGQQAAGMADMAAAQGEFDQVQADAFSQKAAILDEADRVRAEASAGFEVERQAANDRITQSIAQIHQTDPKRWWKNMSGFQKGMAFMSAAIDGYLNPRGPNGAVELAMQLAEQDAAAQAEDNANARAKVGYEQSAYERMLGTQNLKRLDMQEAKVYRLESLAAATEAKGMTFKSFITQEQYRQQGLGIRAQSEQELLKLDQMRVSLHEGAADRASRERMQRESIAFDREKLDAAGRAKAAEGAAAIGDPATGDKMYIDPEIAAGLGDSELKAVRDPEKGIAGYSLFAKDMRELIKLQREIGSKYGGPGGSTNKYVGSEEYQRAKQLYQQIASPERHKLYGAALTKTEAANFREMLPEPETWLSLKSRDNYEKALTSKAHSAQEVYGHQYGLSRKGPDGKLQPVNFEADWALPPEAPVKSFNPVQSVYEVRRGIASGAAPPGDDTLKKIRADIDEAAKMVSRGQPLVAAGGPDEQPIPNEASIPEMISQSAQLADELFAAGRKVEAIQIRNSIGKLAQAANKRSTEQSQAGYGPTIGQGTPLPPTKRRGQVTVLGE